MEERVRSLKRVAALIEERVYDIGAAMSLEVGKNRIEALGEVQETADFFNLYADDYAGHNGFDNPLPYDPLPDFRSHNRSVMKPYGVWVVIAPYNFPFALAGGPVAAGAQAIVLAHPDRAPRGRAAVRVRAHRASFNHDNQEGDGLKTGISTFAHELWQQAGVAPADIDVASIYDDYPTMVLAQLDDLGMVPDHDLARFCRRDIG